MDASNLRPDEGVSNMEASDWKLNVEARKNVVQHIVAALMKCHPSAAKVAASKIEELAVNCEEKVYRVSKNQNEYIQRIRGRLQKVEKKPQNNASNILPTNFSCSGETPSDQASHSIQSQEDNQGQSLITRLGNQSQAHQQRLLPNIQNGIASARVQGSDTSPSAKPPASSLNQVYMPNSVGENINMLNISGNPEKSVGNSVNQVVPSVNYPRQAQGRQHPTQVTKQKQQQSLHLQQNSFQKQLQPQQQLQCQHEHFPNTEPQLCPQSNVFGLIQQCQQPLGLQCINNCMQQAEVAMQGNCQQTVSALLPPQGQQLQTQSPKQQLMSQSQPEKSQKSPDSLQRDMQQRLLTSGTTNSNLETRHANESDWREKVYKKAQTLKSECWTELNEMHQKLTAELKQNSVSQQLTEGHIERSKELTKVLEAISLLNSSKSDIMPGHEERLKLLEKQILCMRYSNRTRKPISLRPLGHLSFNVHQPPESWSQTPQVESPEYQKKPHLQSMNSQSSVTTMQQNNVTSIQNNSTSSLSELAAPQENVMNSRQCMIKSNLEQGNSVKSSQQVALGSLQSPATTPQQPTVNTSLSRSNVRVPLTNLDPLQSNPNMLQRMHPKHKKEQQNVQAQNPRPQAKQHQMQRQLTQKRWQMLQPPPSLQQLPAKLLAHEMPQHQMNEVNDLKVRQGMDVKSGGLQHQSAGQYTVLHHQHLKLPTLHHSAAPQILQHSSPLTNQQNMPTSIEKTGTPFSFANSPSIVTPTPLAPSSTPGDSEKLVSDVPVLSHAGNIGHQQTNDATESATPFVISTPGIPASPLLAEYYNFEWPLNRLVQVVNTMSSKALSASVSEIESLINIANRISGSPPLIGSKGAIGEDMVTMANSHLQARYSSGCNDTFEIKKAKRCKRVMPMDIVSVAGGMDDSFKHFTDMETYDLESTAMSCINRPRTEAHHVLLEEIREINQRLIDTVVDISDEDFNSTAAADATEWVEGTIVKCSFSAVTVNPNLKPGKASILLSPIQPLRLLVPKNYPYCSPILVDKLSVEVSEEQEDLSIKAKSKLNMSLRTLLQPMSLGEIAKTWDICVRAVISEYAQRHGGGNFSSKYGSWENCLGEA